MLLLLVTVDVGVTVVRVDMVVGVDVVDWRELDDVVRTVLLEVEADVDVPG